MSSDAIEIDTNQPPIQIKTRSGHNDRFFFGLFFGIIVGLITGFFGYGWATSSRLSTSDAHMSADSHDVAELELDAAAKLKTTIDLCKIRYFPEGKRLVQLSDGSWARTQEGIQVVTWDMRPSASNSKAFPFEAILLIDHATSSTVSHPQKEDAENDDVFYKAYYNRFSANPEGYTNKFGSSVLAEILFVYDVNSSMWVEQSKSLDAYTPVARDNMLKAWQASRPGISANASSATISQ